MGRYIVQGDIENVFGVDNVATWSNLQNNTTAADTARITKGIEWAEDRLDSMFRTSRYVIPFAGTITEEIKYWVSVMAGSWLHRPRGLRETDLKDKIAALMETVEDDIQAHQSGQRRLNLALIETQPNSPVVVR